MYFDIHRNIKQQIVKENGFISLSVSIDLSVYLMGQKRRKSFRDTSRLTY